MGRPRIYRTPEEEKAIRKKFRDKYYAITKANRVKPAKYIVYTMTDPRNGQVKYVGMTGQSLKQRVKEHLNLAPSVFKRYPQKANWLYELKSNGLLPIVEELGVFETFQAALQEETLYTAMFHTWGFDLTNINFGRRYSHKSKLNHNAVICRKAIETSAERHRRPVVQLTMDGKFVKRWGCAKWVMNAININEVQIANCCKKKKKYLTAGGFKWIYAAEYDLLTTKTKKNVTKNN